ncbi:flagellar basal-body rod protein FlgG [Maribrevibacterium harenarium]|jgi:flagellar basal-body rod protein FlgG|uniref:Flagellar basal-body rod protein FlgG n=1 Tax=Maribrevibacterium harenarium TaxID=2589817 RepID=A0A501X350_9GAMM|nr:flagellar basal-body rod protein FlgG [Maribrevibacterium harenarium]TPE54925.1 flagellar basal-body rod protein FlgG [Maribrevibacterium harenarium]
MHSALWVAKTGLTAMDKQLSVISNNLANVSTTGFKKDRGVFEDLMYQQLRAPGGLSAQNTELPSGLQIGAGVRVTGTQKVFSEGDYNVTDRQLDVAIQGAGFLQIVRPDGSMAYTRDGQLQLNSQGQIVDSSGQLLEPGITIDSDVVDINIGEDGTVSVLRAGEVDMEQIGSIEIANFINPTGLRFLGGNLYEETNASGAPIVGVPGEDGLGVLAQGMLESSNVNSVEELVNMITTQRAYEMNSKVISTADGMLGFVTQQL